MKPQLKFLATALVLSASSRTVSEEDEEIPIGGVAMENTSTSAAFANEKEAGQVKKPNDANPNRGSLQRF